MASNVTVKLLLSISGQAVTFAQPFTIPAMDTEEEPALYEVTIPANSVATLWDGAPLPPTYDFLAIISTQDIDVEFVVNGGQVDEYHFTIPVPQGGFPLIAPGGTAFAGQVGTGSAFVQGVRRQVTKINAKNSNTTDAALVSVLIARIAT